MHAATGPPAHKTLLAGLIVAAALRETRCALPVIYQLPLGQMARPLHKQSRNLQDSGIVCEGVCREAGV